MMILYAKLNTLGISSRLNNSGAINQFFFRPKNLAKCGKETLAIYTDVLVIYNVVRRPTELGWPSFLPTPISSLTAEVGGVNNDLTPPHNRFL